MLIRCLGHSKFLLETAEGFRIVTDPFDASVGYPIPPLTADAVLVSHHHHDHDAVDTVQGWSKMVDAPGVCTLAPGVTVTALPCFHDEVRGAKRGANLIFLLEADGLRLAHLGDLGHLPDEDLAEKLGAPDVLMIPVGGHFTVDAAQAAEICRMLNPRIILPMHYRTAVNASWPIAPVEDFLRLIEKQTGEKAETLSVLRITKEDLSCQMRVAVLTTP